MVGHLSPPVTRLHLDFLVNVFLCLSFNFKWPKSADDPSDLRSKDWHPTGPALGPKASVLLCDTAHQHGQLGHGSTGPTDKQSLWFGEAGSSAFGMLSLSAPLKHLLRPTAQRPATCPL